MALPTGSNVRLRETVVKGAPRTPDELREVLWRAFRLRLPDVRVCEHHSTPWAAFCDAFFARAPVVVWKGSRGLAGKTFSLGLLTVAEGVFLGADVNLLGGSGQQSKLGLTYVSDNLRNSNIVSGGAQSDVAHETRLQNGAVIRALMASQTSVRGPHPQRLRLDECLAAGTMVATPSGLVNIESLSPGDALYCWDEGDFKVGSVRKLWDRGERATVCVQLEDGRRIWATPEHRFLEHSGAWSQADQVSEVCSVSFLWGSQSQVGSPRADLHGLLPCASGAGFRADLPAVRRTEGGPLRWLRALLSRAAGCALAALSGLRSRAEVQGTETLPRLPLEMDERAGRGALQRGPGYGAGQSDQQAGIAGQGAAHALWLAVDAAGADRSLGGGPHDRGHQAGDRSPWRLLARQAGRRGAGRAEATRDRASRVSRADSPIRPDALLVEGSGPVRVVSVTPGPTLRVYDISTQFGTFIAEGCVVHNCDEMDLAVLDAAMGQPMARGGVRSQVVISSTHQYPDGTMSEVLKRAAERGWPVHEFCFHETSAPPHGWLTTEMIEDARTRVTAAMWSTEFELQEPSPEGRAIDTEAVRRVFRLDLGDFPGLEGERVEIEPPQAGARYAHGADWARKVDYTAVATFRIDCVPYRLVAYRCMQRRPWPEMVAELDQRMSRYGGVACHDGTGLGDVVGSMLKLDAEAVLMVGRDRRDILSEYCVAIERGEIEAPMIRSMEAEHRYASVDALYGAGHPPDSIVAGALAYRAARRGTLAASSSSEEADSRLRAGYGRLSGQRSGLMGGRLR